MKSGEGRHTFQRRGLLPERGPMKEAKDSGAWSWNAQVLEPEAEAEKSLRGHGAPRRKARRYCAPSKAPALHWAPGCPLEPQTQGHGQSHVAGGHSGDGRSRPCAVSRSLPSTGVHRAREETMD